MTALRSPDSPLHTGINMLPRLRAMMPGFDIGVFVNNGMLAFSAAKERVSVSETMRGIPDASIIAAYLTQKWHREKEKRAAS